MSVIIDLNDSESVRLTDVSVERRSPDRLAFAAEGNLSVTDALLAQFEGATLRPARITVSSDGSDPVGIDLTESASLRLENVDVGIATPDGDDIAAGIDALRPSADGGPEIDPPPDVLSVTVEGTIRNVPSETFATVPEDVSDFESLTFAVDESVRSDGGRPDDVVLGLSLLGYGIVVRRDGSIVVGNAGSLATMDLP